MARTISGTCFQIWTFWTLGDALCLMKLQGDNALYFCFGQSNHWCQLVSCQLEWMYGIVLKKYIVVVNRKQALLQQDLIPFERLRINSRNFCGHDTSSSMRRWKHQCISLSRRARRVSALESELMERSFQMVQYNDLYFKSYAAFIATWWTKWISNWNVKLLTCHNTSNQIKALLSQLGKIV